MNNDRQDNFLLLLLAAGFIAFGGLPLLLGAVLTPVQQWMLQAQLLLPAAQSDVVIPGTEVGLDFLRLLIFGGLVCLLVGLLALVLRTRRSRP